IAKLPYISEEVSFEDFLEEYPYLLDNVNILFVSEKERQRHLDNAYKLYTNGFYRKSLEKKDLLPQPNYARVTKAIFGRSIIPLTNYSNISALEKYQIKPNSSDRKYKAINHYTDKDKESMSQSSVTALIYIIKHIPVSAQLAKLDNLNIDPSLITLKRLKNLHDFKPVGRTFSLPPIFVLRSMEKAFELNLGQKFKKDDLWYPDLITSNEPVLMIDLLFDTILKFTEETKGLKRNSSPYKNIIKKSTFISDKLKDLGFNKFLNSKGYDPHEVNSVVYFYKVLMGSVHVLTGTLNARRVSEFISLPPFENLVPSDENPWLKNNSVAFADYNLRFWPAKTGVGGKISLLECIERPTPLIIAKLIYKIEKYNMLFIEKGLYSKENIALFNGVSFNNFKLHPLDNKQFNEAISYFCDYINTPTTIINGTIYRYYILEHELRRFFALLFFWSSGDKKMDSLRYQLAQSDVKHLYNYISESITGDVLNSTKATYLAYTFRNLNSTDLEKLSVALINQFGVDSINLKSQIDFMELYFPNGALDEDFNLNIDSKVLIEQSKLEGQIQYLLDHDIITLEPEFFKNESNETAFNFVIKVKDLDNE
ncbi:site-specific recombinase, partial [Vibrio sp. Makdt]|uniref:site-specific recombinase n=1 Tax=Vibrio sp. Makdt TaxID=2998828 RepID=UPI0022CD5199